MDTSMTGFDWIKTELSFKTRFNQQMQSNTTVPTVDIPNARQLKVVLVNI